VRNARWRLVCDGDGTKNWQLFEIKTDPGESNDVASQHRDVVNALDAEYDRWWASLTAYLVNEDAVGPTLNPFKELYWKQFGSGPDDP